jgi:hypothetical protein
VGETSAPRVSKNFYGVPSGCAAVVTRAPEKVYDSTNGAMDEKMRMWRPESKYCMIGEQMAVGSPRPCCITSPFGGKKRTMLRRGIPQLRGVMARSTYKKKHGENALEDSVRGGEVRVDEVDRCG